MDEKEKNVLRKLTKCVEFLGHKIREQEEIILNIEKWIKEKNNKDINDE